MANKKTYDELQENNLHCTKVKDGTHIQALLEKTEEHQEYLLQMQISPKIELVLEAFIPDKKGDITTYKLIKRRPGHKNESLSLSSFGLEKIREFNNLLLTLNLERIKSAEKIPLYSIADIPNNKSPEELRKIVDTVIKHEDFLKEDIIAVSHKRKMLNLFKRGLNGDENIFSELEIIKTGESAWQDFFEANQWIFGYGLDYHFNTILQKEPSISPSNTAGSNVVKPDFLLNNQRFLTYVELKTPLTQLFKKDKNRSNAWKLSTDLLDAYSQVLEHKASAQEYKKGYNGEGKLIIQKDVDPKVILIIGNWKEIEGDSEEEKNIKARTFELFRRDSRNVEIFTYDELLERAEYILEKIGNVTPCKNSTNQL